MADNTDNYTYSKGYQTKIIEKAKIHNSIIYLPTGAGKTLIAIRVLCSKSRDINELYSRNGKRAFFVAPTKVLVIQSATTLLTHTHFQVGYYTGDMNVDSWTKQVWEVQFESNNVIVLTPEILKILLTLNYIHPKRISLIVFDECHNAVLNHPYCKIMSAIREKSESERPLILGLSATLIKGFPKKSISDSLRKLENTFNAKILTDEELNDIVRYSTCPKEEIITYNKYCPPEFVEAASRIYEEAINATNLLPSRFHTSTSGSVDIRNVNSSLLSRIKRCLVNANKCLLNLGAFCGSLAALHYIIVVEKCRLISVDKLANQILIWARTELNKVRRILNKAIGEETLEKIYRFSSPKVKELIKTVEKNSKKNSSCTTIVFVQEKITAICLAFMMKRLCILDENFSCTKPEYITGKVSNILDCKNTKIIEGFLSGEINLLFATNILEEGIDVPTCNAVMSFDFPSAYASYVQSRGRARNKSSIYHVFCKAENNQENTILSSYKKAEREVYEAVVNCHNINSDDTEDSQKELWTEIQCSDSKTLRIDGSSAIQIVNRYCSLLPQDRFSYLLPLLWYNKADTLRVATLQLPITSSLREKITGDPQANIKLAKKSVYLKTLKLLYDLKEIDNNLMIKKFDIRNENFRHLFPHYKIDEDNNKSEQEQRKKKKHIYETSFSECFKNCLPLPKTKSYIHVINFTVAFDKPEIDRKVTLYNLLQNQCTYGILTSKKLPKICQFPLFLSMGEINCNLLVNAHEVYLNSEQLYDIKLFHFAVFQKVLNVLKHSKVYDNSNKEFSLFVVPLRKINQNYSLNWEIIKSDFCKVHGSALVNYNPSSQNARENIRERFQSDKKLNYDLNFCQALVPLNFIDGKKIWANNKEQNMIGRNFIMTEAAYTNFVISPNYRTADSPQYYVVSSISHNMSPLSPFPREEYENFVAYYKDKYNVEIQNLEQPLLKVSNLPICSNFNIPNYLYRNQDRWSKKSNQHEELFVPELCNVYPFIRVYWLKALLLPTVINRITHIYRADELRRTIARETGLGVVELPNNLSWQPLEVNALLINNENECVESKPKLDLPLSQLKFKDKKNDISILEYETNLYEIGLCDLENYIKMFQSTDPEDELKEIEILKNNDGVIRYKELQDVDVPKLKLMDTVGSELGPELVRIVEACTSKSANDIINYELLEILGDSFLKFATTTFLLKSYSLTKEGILTDVKGKLVGNRNLFYCALAKNLPKFINANDFSPLSDWNPPLFCIPEQLVNEMVSENLDPAIISRFSIPEEEQLSGILSEETLEKNKEIILKYGEKADFQVSPLIGREALNCKIISDVVEALTGTYLLEFGLPGGFAILNWFDVLPRESGSFVKVVKEPFHFETLTPHSESDVMNLLHEVSFSSLEELLGYQFKNKAILLEALTHPSYFKNRITLTYQRLEFLGDAILDFLLTTYVYENYQHLNPGLITDIRSSLVNNITFACLCVRYGFHKFLLSASSELLQHIEKFYKFQAERDHVVDENVMILLEEEDCLIAETIKAPKALGDVFESIAGAIYVDSGNSLETVWKIYYKLMKREIDKFTQTVPKTALRLLHEICGGKPYFETLVGENVVSVTCTVFYNNNEITAHGFGENKNEAKKSASKIVLKKILELNNLG